MKLFASKKEFWFVLLAAVAIAVIVFIRLESEVTAPTTKETSDTVPVSETELPDFARVEIRDGVRVLVNERDGYEVVLEDDWRPEYYTNVIEVVVDDNYPSGELTASFSIIDNPKGDLTLDEWSNRWLNVKEEVCNNCYVDKGSFSVENIEVKKIFDKAGIGGDRYDYLFIKDDKFFSLNTVNLKEDKILNIIKEIKTL